MREQFRLVFALYHRPVQAASQIIDRGSLWFAFLTALLAIAALQFGPVPMAARIILQSIPAGEPRALPPLSSVLYQRHPALAALLDLLPSLMDPLIALKLVAFLAVAFVPAVMLVMALYRYERFAATLRRDFLPLLNCLLLSLCAASVPVSIGGMGVLLATKQIRLVAVLGVLGLLYFLFLTVCSVRTVWGSSFRMAAVASGVGCLALTGIVAGSAFGLGVLRYAASPCLLYYAWVLVGSDVRSLGELARSRQHLRRQLDLATHNPRDADAHYQLGLLYLERRQFEEARPRFERAIEIDAHEPEPYYQLGRIALAQGQPETAVAWFGKAAALDDRCAKNEVWRELGVAHWKALRPEAARAALDKYIERRPYDPEGLYWLGKTLAALDRVPEAQQSFQGCVEAVNTMPAYRRGSLGKWRRLAMDELRPLQTR